MLNNMMEKQGLSADFKQAFMKRFVWLAGFVLLFSTLLMALSGVGFIHAAEKIVKKSGAHKTEKAASKLVEYEILDLIQSKSIKDSLTGKKGDPKRGEAIVLNPKTGNCLQCHVINKYHKMAKTNPNVYGDMGEIGPFLDGVSSRYKESELRLILVNAKLVFPETIMPAFYRVKGFTRVADEYVGQPIMNAQDIEDVLSFLMKLK